MTIKIEGSVREVPSERGLKNIRVSNGEHIVQTDADGRYALEVEPGDHRFVFVTVPDGFQLCGNFYRSDTRLDRIPATGCGFQSHAGAGRGQANIYDGPY